MKKDLITRLNEGPIMCAEGYLFAMERRGYLSAGPFVPEVVLEHPEVVVLKLLLEQMDLLIDNLFFPLQKGNLLHTLLGLHLIL